MGFLRFFIKLLPFFPAKKDKDKLIYAIVYHVVVQFVALVLYLLLFIPCAIMIWSVILSIFGLLLFFLDILLFLLCCAYTGAGIALSICSFNGVRFLNEFQPADTVSEETAVTEDAADTAPSAVPDKES